MKFLRLSAVFAVVACTVTLAACVPDDDAGSVTVITVETSTESCAVSLNSVKSGTLTFSVRNPSDQIAQFFLLTSDGLRIVGKVENLVPGMTRDLVLQAQPGNYLTGCRPGAARNDIGRSGFTVTGDRVQIAGDVEQQAQAATSTYSTYVKDQCEQLVSSNNSFLEAYLANDVATARANFPITRTHYERIEPIASSFRELDSALTNRQTDIARGRKWLGWHRIEKDLFPPAPSETGHINYVPLTTQERAYYSRRLKSDTQALCAGVADPDNAISIDAIANSASNLLENALSRNITGQEDIWSHTDLWDMQANVEGARVAYNSIRDIVALKDPTLVGTIDGQFDAFEKSLSRYGNLDKGFIHYNRLTLSQVTQLTYTGSALSESLTHLSATLLS